LTVGGTEVAPVAATSRNKTEVITQLESHTSTCGYNTMLGGGNRIMFILTGADTCIVKLEMMEAVQVSLKLEMPLTDFYSTNGPTLFIDRMAAFLGIPNDKLRIVSITEGSVDIRFEIVMDDETRSSPTV